LGGLVFWMAMKRGASVGKSRIEIRGRRKEKIGITRKYSQSEVEGKTGRAGPATPCNRFGIELEELLDGPKKALDKVWSDPPTPHPHPHTTHPTPPQKPNQTPRPKKHSRKKRKKKHKTPPTTPPRTPTNPPNDPPPTPNPQKNPPPPKTPHPSSGDFRLKIRNKGGD